MRGTTLPMGLVLHWILLGAMVASLLTMFMAKQRDWKQRLFRRWLLLSVVWSLFWLGSGTLDIYLRSGCHFGKCIVRMEEIRPIVILGPALIALPWLGAAIVACILWFYRWAWRRQTAR